MTSKISTSTSESSYESFDSISNPEKYAREEWIKYYGEPKTFEEHKECEDYVISKKSDIKKNKCTII